jgi:3D (Asp-Asp-Asp) domain-containing protein
MNEREIVSWLKVLSFQLSVLTLVTLAGSCRARGATVTGYCQCTKCTPGWGLTASGSAPSSVTVAGPRSVPLGTWVEITLPGRAPVRKRVEDRTAKRYDGRWDLFFPDHVSAKRFGIVTNASVRILR